MQTPFITRQLLFGTYYDVVANTATGKMTFTYDGGSFELDIAGAIASALTTYASTKINEIVNALSTAGGRLAVCNPAVPQDGDLKVDATKRYVYVYSANTWWPIYPASHTQNGAPITLTASTVIPD